MILNMEDSAKKPTVKKPTAKKPVVVKKPKSNKLGQAGLEPKKYTAPKKSNNLGQAGLEPKKYTSPAKPVVKKPVASKPYSSSSSSGGGSKSSGGGGGGGGGGSSSGGKTSNNGTSAGSAPGYNQAKDPNYIASLAKLNGLWQQANGYKGQIDGMMKTGFTYDPNKDASYKSLQELATKNAKIASGEAMETMNDRGIVNSTVTGDRLGQIEQTAQDAVTAQIPGLKNAAYGQYMDKLSTLNNLWNSTVAQAQQERSFNEDKRRWELGYQMDQDQFNTSKSQWNQTFNYQKSQDEINNAFKDEQLNLDYLNYDLADAKQAQDLIGVNNQAQTNAVITELLKYKTKEDIIKHLQANVGKYNETGANISAILTALNKYFPGIEQEATKKKAPTAFK